MRPPEVRHGERIPAEVLAAMRASWDRGWFAPRPVRICVLENVFVAWEGLVYTADLEVIRSSVSQHSDDDVERSRAAIEIARKTSRSPALSGDVVLARKRGAANYGHWLVEMLPAAWLACQHWPHPLRVMVQAADEPLRSVMLQSLALIGATGPLVVEVGTLPVLVERLIMVEGLTDHGSYMSPLVSECLQAITAAIPAEGSERLVVTRGTMASRRLSDEAAFLAAAARAGFAVIDPASLPFRAQVAAFKAARRIVGTMGAALTNLAFTGAGAEVFMLAPAEMPDTFYWFIGGLGGLQTIDIRCRQVPPVIGPAPWDTGLALDPQDREDMFASAPAAPIGAAGRTAPEMNAMLQHLFDPGYYLRSNPDVAACGLDPLAHYMAFGWREGRNPSSRFDAQWYIDTYRDVGEAALNPLVHYIIHGASEGREIKAVFTPE